MASAMTPPPIIPKRIDTVLFKVKSKKKKRQI
jgi:hypothetical protein